MADDKKPDVKDPKAQRAEEISKEQDKMKDLAAQVEGKDHFSQQEIFAKAFEEKEGEDSYRRAARFERERDAALFAGDPTRDPVAKQKVMDMNTPAPGVQEDAQRIKDVGEQKAKEEKERRGTDGPVNQANVNEAPKAVPLPPGADSQK